MLARFLARQGGATSIEYALVAGLVSIVILAAVRSTGTSLNAMFFGPLMSGFK